MPELHDVAPAEAPVDVHVLLARRRIAQDPANLVRSWSASSSSACRRSTRSRALMPMQHVRRRRRADSVGLHRQHELAIHRAIECRRNGARAAATSRFDAKLANDARVRWRWLALPASRSRRRACPTRASRTPIMWSSACTRLTSATCPAREIATSMTYRSDGPTTTLSTNASRSNFPAVARDELHAHSGSENDRL